MEPKQLQEEAIEELARLGQLADPGRLTEEELSGMVAALLALPDLRGLVLARFRELILDGKQTFGRRLQYAMRRGTFPRVELLIHQDGEIN